MYPVRGSTTNFARFKNVMSHPFVLLVAGAIISSLIFPYFTRVWQDAQKELQLQSELADTVNRAISSFVVATDLAQNPDYAAGNTERLTNAYVEWLIDKSLIHSKLQIFYNDKQLTKNWDNLSSAVTELNYIASIHAERHGS